jgi:hypothetical protein
MGQIAAGKPSPMITDLHVDDVAIALGDELHVPGAMCQSVVHQVAQGVLQSLPVG